MPDLRIVYMGTPDFAVYPLQYLLEAGHQVVGVVTNPDKPAGRGQKLQESPVKKFAMAHGLPVLQPVSFTDEAFLAGLREWKADLQLVVAFKMLPEVVWNMPRLGTVNLHASLLPDYRGAAPINRVIMNGEELTGVTTFLLKQAMDTGHVIFQEQVEIGETMNAGELHDHLMEIGAELLLKTVDAMASGDYPLVRQEELLQGRKPKLAPKIFKEDMRIPWDKNIQEIYNHIRGLSPFPAAWTMLKHRETGEEISARIFDVEPEVRGHHQEMGLATDGKSYFSVYVPGGVIYIRELQLAGKKRMPVTDFLRGFNLSDYTLS